MNVVASSCVACGSAAEWRQDYGYHLCDTHAGLPSYAPKPVPLPAVKIGLGEFLVWARAMLVFAPLLLWCEWLNVLNGNSYTSGSKA